MTVKEGYIRVSSILAQWDRYAKIDPQVLAKKCATGNSIHAAIDNYCKHGIEPVEDPEITGYFESYRMWNISTGVINASSEQRLYCDKLKITGCIDAIAKLESWGGFTLIDYKTSAQESPKIWPMQACFYHYLAIQNGIPVSDRIIFLKLDKAGKMPKVFEYHYSAKLMNVCMSALNCYTWLNS